MLTKYESQKKGKLVFGGYVLCIAGLILLYIRFNQPKPKGDTDFKFVSGQFESYSFRDGSRGYHNYTFRLKNFINSFKIKADFLDFFYASNFKQLNEGDSLTVGISNTDINKLNSTSDYLFVYSIKSNTSTFLDSKDTIAFQNSNHDYYYFGGLLLLGLTFLYFGYKSKIKTEFF
jgi:hypothetical protein